MAREGRGDGTLPEITAQRRWKPSLGFKIGMSGVAFFAGLLIVAGVLGSSGSPRGQADATAATPTPEPQPTTRAPHRETKDDEFAISEESVPGGVPGAAAGSVETTATPANSHPATATPTVGDDWSATPAPAPQFETGALDPQATALVAQIEAQYGVRIVVSGQHWGDDASTQLRNLGAVAAALESLPDGLVAEVVDGPGGPLTFLSNDHGRTEAGWQPYGDRAANFYSNEDRGVVSGPANQVILQPGSTGRTITHELVHAYQLRETAPGAYVTALLTPEMKSFMQSTGWRQLVSDQELMQVNAGSWDAINALFVYEGRPLSYVNDAGSQSSLYAPNPLEAFAESAALYYAHGPAVPLPDWAEYWSWFASNLG